MRTLPFPKLFITDLDGTALGGGFKPYARIPDDFSSFLDRLSEHGCDWATCTTWEMNVQLQLLQASPVRTAPSFVVVGSGLYLCKLLGDELLKIDPYSLQMQLQLDEIVEAELRPVMRAACTQFDCSKMNFSGSWFSMTVQEEDTERMMEVVGELASQYSNLKFERVPEEQRFYVHPAFMRKGTPVKEILRLTGLTPDDIVVAGDEMMDLHMMTSDVATHVICPSNAHPEVKARVLERGGFVGDGACSVGVMDAFSKLARARGWDSFV